MDNNYLTKTEGGDSLKAVKEFVQSLNFLIVSYEDMVVRIKQEELRTKELEAEIESLRAQLQEKEVQLSEQRKLTTGMAKKSSEEDLLKAFRTYANRSKRKTLDKRAFAKSAMLEIANANGLILPEDLTATIDSLDDEQPESPAVTTVNVAAGGINVQQVNTVKV